MTDPLWIDAKNNIVGVPDPFRSPLQWPPIQNPHICGRQNFLLKIFVEKHMWSSARTRGAELVLKPSFTEYVSGFGMQPSIKNCYAVLSEVLPIDSYTFSLSFWLFVHDSCVKELLLIRCKPLRSPLPDYFFWKFQSVAQPMRVSSMKISVSQKEHSLAKTAHRTTLAIIAPQRFPGHTEILGTSTIESKIQLLPRNHHTMNTVCAQK